MSRSPEDNGFFQRRAAGKASFAMIKILRDECYEIYIYDVRAINEDIKS